MQAAGVHQWLTQAGITMKREWLEACVDWILNEEARLRELVYEQWQHADLRDVVAECCIPEGVTQQQKLTINGLFVVQIDSIVDVGTPAYSQLQKLKGQYLDTSETPDDKKNYETKPTRMLLMSLTDGVREFQAMEYQPIPQLCLQTVLPGAKLRLEGSIHCRLGVLLLCPSHVQVLGGKVEDLLERNQQKKCLARALNNEDLAGDSCHPTGQSQANQQHLSSSTSVPTTSSARVQPACPTVIDLTDSFDRTGSAEQQTGPVHSTQRQPLPGTLATGSGSRDRRVKASHWDIQSTTNHQPHLTSQATTGRVGSSAPYSTSGTQPATAIVRHAGIDGESRLRGISGSTEATIASGAYTSDLDGGIGGDVGLDEVEMDISEFDFNIEDELEQPMAVLTEYRTEEERLVEEVHCDSTTTHSVGSHESVIQNSIQGNPANPKPSDEFSRASDGRPAIESVALHLKSSKFTFSSGLQERHAGTNLNVRGSLVACVKPYSEEEALEEEREPLTGHTSTTPQKPFMVSNREPVLLTLSELQAPSIWQRHPIVKVKAHFVKVVKQLSYDTGVWMLTILIGDDEGTKLNVHMNNEIVERLLGFSAVEYGQHMKPNRSDPKVKSRGSRGFKRCQSALCDLNCFMELGKRSSHECPFIEKLLDN